MSSKKIGLQTVKFENPPVILAAASTVGPKEGEGPLFTYFDNVLTDDLFGEDSWEKAESKILRETIKRVVEKGNLELKDVEYILAGDLLNQISAATFAARPLEVPFIGIFGACSTMALGMSLGSMLIDGGFADYIVAGTSSHFCSAEKQFRFPLQLGNQRNMTAQWTVTGSGATLLSSKGTGPVITHNTIGKIIDLGIKDASQMGAAMAPSAADTIVQHFIDTERTAEDYDLIVTGDLGKYGKELCIRLIEEEGYDVRDKFDDCGCMIFDFEKQDVHGGASGCGCSASVFNGYLYKLLLDGTYNNILFLSTGALLSPLTSQQGESIPCIAHAVSISMGRGKGNI